MIIETKGQKNYELLDTGEGEKLEKYGDFVLRRPDPQALWPKRLDGKDWAKADAVFVKKEGPTSRGETSGEWKIKKNVPEKWQIEFGGINLWIRPTPFKHTGLFPEQTENWIWASDLIKKRLSGVGGTSGDKNEVSVLNLFGYTGGASVSASLAGANVTHVDASKAAITWANANAEASGLADDKIRWILDDALDFVKKEVRRGRKYDAIIMDPPAFGRGAKGEIWKIEESFLDLLKESFKLLSDKPLFVILNGYAAGYSAIAYENNLIEIKAKFGGEIDSGELAIRESGTGARLLPCGIVARWKSL